MAFSPSTLINIGHVDFDNSYQNQRYFNNFAEQIQYFASCGKKSFTEFVHVRENLPDGSTISAVKVPMHVDELKLLGANYMWYQNAFSTDKIFFAFITDLVYINENTTKIYFETDVFQTWLFDFELMESYVVREHTLTDEIGYNVVPEKFNFQDYVYKECYEGTELNEWGYLIATSNDILGSSLRGQNMCGIYQGLYFYYFDEITEINNFIAQAEDREGDVIQFITAIPRFCIKNNQSYNTDTTGELKSSAMPSQAIITLTKNSIFNNPSLAFNGYVPKNKKLYTSPFFNLVISNHAGEEAEYNFEDFNSSDFKFSLRGDISASPSITIYPFTYKGVSNYDNGISISGFPQCSYNADNYKLWLVKNKNAIALSYANAGLSAVSGVASIVTGNVGGGVSGVASGVMGVLQTMDSKYQASREPNRVNTGNANNNLITALGFNKFSFYTRSIKPQFARVVDDFFTMYGYQTNTLKRPSMNNRPYYTYVQTVDVNIRGTGENGSIPRDDVVKLKSIFNKGCTFWTKNAIVGDYSVDNQPE